MKHISLCFFSLLATFAYSQTDQLLYDQNKVHHSWAYQGEYGPDHWAEIDPAYASCSGEVQSPINVKSGKCLNSQLAIEFHYHPFFVDLVNNGHTLIEQVVEPKALVFNEEQFTLLQFHFHTPSEHHINDAEYPMEIHFVHRSAKGSYAVVAVFIQEGEQSNPFLRHFMKSLPTQVGEEIRSFEKADPFETFPKHLNKFYHYTGSLTTPPCTEGINWILMAEPVMATKHQIEAIHSIVHNDNRPIQEINDRQVFFVENIQY